MFSLVQPKFGFRALQCLIAAVCLLSVFEAGLSRAPKPLNDRSAQRNSIAPPATVQESRTRSEIVDLERLLPQIVDRGAALYLLAKRYARLGQTQKALGLLKECISLDEGFDPEHAPDLQPLNSDPEFRTLVEHVHRRYPPVHKARVAFTIPETDLFPEGLAADPVKKLFYMGSMHRRKILRITEAGDVSDFVKPGLYDLMPVGGVKVDQADHGVWAATDPGEQSRSELVHFDSNGKLLERFPAPGPGPHNLNDLVLRNSDEIYRFYFIANTGIANLKDDKIIDLGKLEAIHIAVVPLK
jgi:hypothetical protein